MIQIHKVGKGVVETKQPTVSPTIPSGNVQIHSVKSTPLQVTEDADTITLTNTDNMPLSDAVKAVVNAVDKGERQDSYSDEQLTSDLMMVYKDAETSGLIRIDKVLISQKDGKRTIHYTILDPIADNEVILIQCIEYALAEAK